MGKTITVATGDTLSSLALRHLGDGNKWRTIWTDNAAVIGANPNNLRVGMRLVINETANHKGVSDALTSLDQAVAKSVRASRSPVNTSRGIFPNDRFPGYISFTFDDGPHPENTGKVLSILAQHQIHATFFVLGQNAQQFPSLISRIVREGHGIGNHSYDHQNFNALSPEAIHAELDKTDTILNRILGEMYAPLYVRTPYGNPFFGSSQVKQEQVQAEIEKLNSANILWQIDSDDWRYKGQPEKIVSHVAGQLNTGGVVLMHDIHSQTVAALPTIIGIVKDRQLQIVSLDVLLDMKRRLS